MVFTSSSLWRTIPLSMLSFPESQSTSDHFRAKHSLIRRPKQTPIRAIVRKGSPSSRTNLRNSSTVRLRGSCCRLEEPLTVTKLIGLACTGTTSLHMAKAHSLCNKPRTCERPFGDSFSDSNHCSTGRGFQICDRKLSPSRYDRDVSTAIHWRHSKGQNRRARYRFPCNCALEEYDCCRRTKPVRPWPSDFGVECGFRNRKHLVFALGTIL